MSKIKSFKVVQIIPAFNWFASYEMTDESGEIEIELVPVICWALGMADKEIEPSIHGMIQINKRVVVAESAPNFAGYDAPVPDLEVDVGDLN